MVSSVIKYGSIAVGAAVVVAFAYFLTRENPKKLYRRASSLHKQGELYYNDGDSELAEEYYRESEMLREKARGLA